MSAVQCPGCGTRYRVKPESAGKRSKCRKCGTAFRIPAARPTDERLQVEIPDSDALADGTTIAIQLAMDVPASIPAAGLGPSDMPVGYAEDQAASAGGGYGGFFRSMALSAAFPARLGDLVTFIFVGVLLALAATILPFGMCIGTLACLIIVGWYLSFLLNIVVGATAGDRDLPSLTLTEGTWDGIVFPFIKMFAASAVALLPFVVFMCCSVAFGGLVLSSGSGPSGIGQQIAAGGVLVSTVLLLMLAGFVWPIVVLVVAVGGIAALARIDLIFRTIILSFPAYLLIVLTVWLAIGLKFASAAAVAAAAGSGPMVSFGALAIAALMAFVKLYFDIIAMRAIGFYYHHFKHRFAWSWG